MKKAIFLVSILLLLSTILGCGPVPLPQIGGKAIEVTRVVEVEVAREMVTEAERMVMAPAPSVALAEKGLPQERMIIRNGELSLEVEDTEKVMGEIKSIVEGLGGYVADSRTWWAKGGPEQEEEKPWGHMTVRVPAKDFDEAVEEIKKLALKVNNEQISGEDITQEYVDLEARLKNLEAAEEELRELLASVQERGGDAEDIIAIYRELTSIRGEIEQITGRMKYLSQMAALATISIELVPKEEEKPIVEPGWRPLRTVRDASRGLVNALKRIVDLTIWVVIGVLPLILLFAIPVVIVIWLIWRWLRRRKGQ